MKKKTDFYLLKQKSISEGDLLPKTILNFHSDNYFHTKIDFRNESENVFEESRVPT